MEPLRILGLYTRRRWDSAVPGTVQDKNVQTKTIPISSQGNQHRPQCVGQSVSDARQHSHSWFRDPRDSWPRFSFSRFWEWCAGIHTHIAYECRNFILTTAFILVLTKWPIWQTGKRRRVSILGMEILAPKNGICNPLLQPVNSSQAWSSFKQSWHLKNSVATSKKKHYISIIKTKT
jgi:hypothetical protein